MDKRKALELLKLALDEITNLREKHYDNQDFELWVSKIKNIIKNGLGEDDYKTFVEGPPRTKLSRDLPSERLNEHYQREITLRETAVKKVIQKYELLGIEAEPTPTAETKATAELPIDLFDRIQFHPKVVEASRELFKDGHYRDAIYRAFVEVNNFVKDKADSQLDGRKLMSTVFSLDSPIIKLNSLKTQSDRDEQEGFMFLFMGAMEGIRNPKAHENIIQNDPLRTVEYLCLASLLMKIAEEGKLVEL